MDRLLDFFVGPELKGRSKKTPAGLYKSALADDLDQGMGQSNYDNKERTVHGGVWGGGVTRQGCFSDKC